MQYQKFIRCYTDPLL